MFSEELEKIKQSETYAKELQKKGGVCYQKIIELFGTEIIGTDGELDRSRLAALIFQDVKMRQKLNGIVHPEVKKWVEQDIEEKKKRKVPLYVIEAALLPEAGYEDICGEMWYIYAKESVRRERLKQSRGYSDEKIARMMEAQSPERIFRSACQAVIDNSGAFDNTKRQIGEIL